MKRYVALLITLIIAIYFLCPLTCEVKAEDQDGIILSVSCISNLTDVHDLDLLISEGKVYLRSKDAAALGGFTEKEASNGLEYVRNGLVVTQSSYRLINEEKWVQLERTMNQLKVSVAYAEGVLVAVGREHTAQDLFDITDNFMQDKTYNLSNESNLLMKTSTALATLYNRLFKLFDAATGIYDQDKYFDTFRLLLEASENDELLKTLIDGNKLLGKLSKLQEYELGTSKEEALMEMLREGKISDYALILPVYKSVTDPFNYLLDHTSVGQSVKLGGLDVFTQIKLYSDIHSIVSSSSFFTNMLLYTYSEEAYAIAQKDASSPNSKDSQIPTKYLPLLARNGIDRIKTYAKNNTSDQIMAKVLEDELVTVTTESLSKIFSKAAFGKYSILMSIQKMFNESVFPKTTSLIDYLETYAYLCKLQRGLPGLYNCYRADTDTAINAKYTTLLYLRIVQTAYESSVKSGIVEDKYSITEKINKDMEMILAISDSDLAGFQDNTQIDVAKIVNDMGITNEDGYLFYTDDQPQSQEQEDIEGGGLTDTQSQQHDLNYNGLAAWWYGNENDYFDHVNAMDMEYGRSDNICSREMPSEKILGYEMNDWIDVLKETTSYFSPYCDIIIMGFGTYDFSDKSVVLIDSETLGWGESNGKPIYREEFYLFKISGNNGDEDQICVREANIDNDELTINAKIYSQQQSNEDREIEQLLGNYYVEPGELFYKWNEYAALDLWGDGIAGECPLDWRQGQYLVTDNYSYSLDNGVPIGEVGAFFGYNATDSYTWFSNVVNEEQFRRDGESALHHVLTMTTSGDEVEVTGSELYGWHMGDQGGYAMETKEELYEVVVTIRSMGMRYDMMIDMTSTYDHGEGLCSILVGVESLDSNEEAVSVQEGDIKSEGMIQWDTDEEGDLFFSRGIINEPVYDYYGFYDRYSYDEYIPIGEIDDSSFEQGWTWATVLSTAGSIYYVVDNCDDYANIYAEADSTTPVLQQAHRGNGIPVIGWWHDWALCICEDYYEYETNIICGWIENKYLTDETIFSESENENNYPEEDYSGLEYPNDDYDEEGFYYEGSNEYLGTYTVVNCEEWVSLREMPDTSSNRICQVPFGADVDAFYYTDEWYECFYQGHHGYILSRYLTDWPEKYDGYLELFGDVG